MRKLLFVTFSNSQTFSGGSQCAKRNLQSLQELLGHENVTPYVLTPDKEGRRLKGSLQRALGIAKGYFGSLTERGLREIMQLLRNCHFTDLFIDSSQLGLLARYARSQCPKVRITVFFQNIEYDFFRSNVLQCHDYIHSFWIPLARHNELCACRYADTLIVLNNKDARRLESLYGRHADAVIPITMRNDYTPTFADKVPSPKQHPSPKQALFVGSYFFGNTKGLKWFCNDILPHTDAHLTIVGSGMDAFARDNSVTEQITIYSNVPDLTPYYEAADLIVLPIISGGGMKVKTAEALKYGKYIIGTREALEGYDVTADIATECADTASFIAAINSYSAKSPFNAASRQTFVTKYAYEISLQLFKTALSIT